MRRLPTTNLIVLIIGRAQTNKKVVVISSNLKGTHKKIFREGAGDQRAATTELTNALASLAAKLPYTRISD